MWKTEVENAQHSDVESTKHITALLSVLWQLHVNMAYIIERLIHLILLFTLTYSVCQERTEQTDCIWPSVAGAFCQ